MRAFCSPTLLTTVLLLVACSSDNGGNPTTEGSGGESGGGGESTNPGRTEGEGGRASQGGAEPGGEAGTTESASTGGVSPAGGRAAGGGGDGAGTGGAVARGGRTGTGDGGAVARGGRTGTGDGGAVARGGRTGTGDGGAVARGGRTGTGDGGAEPGGGRAGASDGGAEPEGGRAGASDGGAVTEVGGNGAGGLVQLPRPACDIGEGDSEVAEPSLIATLSDRWHEAWLGSPAVADINEDGENEILVPRGNLLLGWHLDGTVVFRAETAGGRIWASPIVADLVPDSPGLEIAVASREEVYVWDSSGDPIAPFPVAWRDELRAIAAGDVDGDGELELVAVTTNKLEEGGLLDIIIAYELDGSVVPGFPPNTTGTSGCDERCYTQGGFDQTLALGDIDGDGASDIFAPQDNAYVSLHRGDGYAFDSNPMFEHPSKVNGVRFLHNLAEAQQGWAEDEETALQAHFTNTAPAIVDLDQDGALDLVMVGSVQNAAQDNRLQGVALWAIHPDGTRLASWTEPLHFPDYLAGLWDFEDTNVVAATNQVAVAETDPDHAGPELIFAGFDGRIHAISADRQELWSYEYTTDDRVLTGGVLVADLSRDGIPEIVLNSYSPDNDKSHLFVLDASGRELHKIPLPERGAMPVPTIADVDQDGTVEIVVSLKDGVDWERQVLVYSVPGSGTNCLLWPTGRGNYRRDGAIPMP